MFSSSLPLPAVRLALLPLALAAAFSASAQQAPDAGRTLQEQQAAPLLPHLPKAPLRITPAGEGAPPVAGGPRVVLQSLEFSGNTLFADGELGEVVGPVAGQSFDLAGLQALADKVTHFYRAAGYPLNRAFLPVQGLNDGRLRIEVLEARYGSIQASGDERLRAGAEAFLAPLQPSQVIESTQLERTLRILGEQPGVTISPVVRAGGEAGSADLDVRTSPAQPVRGEIGLDNHGNRYTGEYQLRASLRWDSPFLFGDQLTAQGTYSDEALWFGHLGYSLPLGISGLRANLAYARTYYQLAKDFAALDATGTADTTSAGLSYPLSRSPEANWTLAVGYEHKKLHDKRGALASDDDKTVDALPLALQFDLRDRWAGGAITYGSVNFAAGKLALNPALATTDELSGRHADGHFSKASLNLARLQATPLEALTLFARIAAQWSDRNLDSSEKFSLGGANGVRAYPVGEGLGDHGWLLQLEARYTLGAFAPFVFYDAGRVQLHAKPAAITPAISDNQRSVAGAGAGVRYSDGSWSADLAIAWRTQGGNAESDPARNDPHAWLKLAYHF